MGGSAGSPGKDQPPEPFSTVPGPHTPASEVGAPRAVSLLGLGTSVAVAALACSGCARPYLTAGHACVPLTTDAALPACASGRAPNLLWEVLFLRLVRLQRLGCDDSLYFFETGSFSDTRSVNG